LLVGWVFSEIRMSQIGVEPPAAARASSKARLMIFAVRARVRPIGRPNGLGHLRQTTTRIDVKAFDT